MVLQSINMAFIPLYCRIHESKSEGDASKYMTDAPIKMEEGHEVDPMDEVCKPVYVDSAEKSTSDCILAKGLEKSDSNYEGEEQIPLAKWVAEIRNRNLRDRLRFGANGTARSLNGASAWLKLSNSYSI